MHPEEIKAAMRMKGTTPAALADELRLSKSTVSQIINGAGTSRRVQDAIAQLIGRPVDEIWAPKAQSGLRRVRNKKEHAVSA
jgi:lambda repressor-like predicted transcriptional regulator